MIFTACTPGGGLDENGNGDNTEQPGGGNQGGEEIPADKTQAIKFQDENTKLLCTLHWDENEDGELSYEEAATVTDLGTAFKGSSILAFTELKYFTSLEKIADNAFEGCVSLVKITMPEQLTIIGTSAFNGCTNLKKIAIPNAVTSIGDDAFYGCTSLTSVTIPDSVTKIGDYAFDSCTSLTDTYVNITDLAAYATSNNTHFFPGYKHLLVDSREITELVIPDSVTSIGEDAFYKCTSLTSVTIPDSVTEIGDCAFLGCTSLTSVTIPDSVTEIGDCAFLGCTSLTSVTIPDSVTSIGDYAFRSCTSLKAFYGKFASSDNRCLIVDGVLNSFAPAGLTEYTIPNSVTSIGRSAFEDCTSLTSVTIPDSVTSIGWWAFYNCSSLTSVTIGNSVTSIGYRAFYNCSSLTSVYCKPTTPPTGDYDMFHYNASGRKIYVPRNSVNAYKSESYWSEYKSYIVGYDF